MLKKIKIYGDLADFIGYKELEAVVDSTADVVRFLICNFPKVESYMMDKYYKVLVNNVSITKEEIHDPTGKSDISIVPVISGAGGDTENIILGAALVGFAIASGGTGLVGLSFAPTGGALASPFAAQLGNIGLGLLLSGVSNLLFPQEQPEDFENDQDPRISFDFAKFVVAVRAFFLRKKSSTRC